MTDTLNALSDAINKFYITTNKGKKIWAPYLRNDIHSQNDDVPRGLGKSSPDEILCSANYIELLYPDISTENIKLKLTDGSLPQKNMNYKGVDCSGFAYQVMNTVYLQCHNYSLMDILGVPKELVVNGALNFEEWQAAYKISASELTAMPETVSMNWVCETFKRKPINLCNVATLISSYSSDRISQEHILPGDLLYIQPGAENIGHVAIICSVENKSLTIAHSTRASPTDPGGIKIEDAVLHTSYVDLCESGKRYSDASFFRLKLQ